MALFTGAFFVAQVSLIIVAKPFYAIFCTSCVPHKPKVGFTACQMVDNLERPGTLWYAMKQIWRTKKIIKMASNIEIQKKCEWCGTIFTAHKITTAYCSHRCANLAYKDRVRKKRIQEFHLKHDAELKPNSEKKFLTPTEVAAFLGVGRTSIYRYIKNAKIKAVRFDGKTLVRRSDIDKMFDYIIASNNENKPKEKTPISDFYTTAEVKEKYGVKDSWIFHIAKEHNIPRTFQRGKTSWSKKHVDDYFTKKAPDPEIKEWYSTQDMQEKFGMTLTAIYSFVSKNAIPKKKVGIMVYYSKKHVDIAKGLIAPEEPKYYTIAETMERFNLTRDQLYHYVKYHNIPRIKVGKYTKILRADLDKFFEPPKIEWGESYFPVINTTIRTPILFATNKY